MAEWFFPEQGETLEEQVSFLNALIEFCNAQNLKCVYDGDKTLHGCTGYYISRK